MKGIRDIAKLVLTKGDILGIETKYQIICTNGNEAFVYIHNSTREIKVEIDGSIENLGKITLDEVVKRVCQ